MAALLFCANRPQAASRSSDPGLALFQGLLGRSGRIDDRPVDRANIIFLLKFGNLGRRIGGVALAAADAAQSGRKIGDEKEPDKPDVQLARGIADRGSFRLTRKHRVDHDGMALRQESGRRAAASIS